MSSFTGIVLFLSIIFGSLALVSFVNRIQTRNRLVRQKVSQMRRRLDELEDLSASIEPLLESVLVPKIINEEVIDLINSIDQLDPNASWLEVRRANAADIAEKLNMDQRTLPFNRIQSSDASIARAKYYLTEAARVVRRHHALNRLESAEMEGYVKELAWAHTMVDVISHVAQGHKAVNRDDPTVAYGYYRKAQNLLMSTNSSDERRHRFIKEIGEIFAGKRLSISPELMPESEFNPTKKPNFNQGGMDNEAESAAP